LLTAGTQPVAGGSQLAGAVGAAGRGAVRPDPDLDRGVFCSPHDLTTALEAWIKLWNQGARHFAWTKNAGQIIDCICRCCSRISESAH
jgi:hypothetical protein